MGPPRLGRAVPFYSSEIGFSDDSLSRFSPVFDTTSPGGRAATDGPRWHASRESHPSEDRSELPPLRDPGVTRGCGWAGVSFLDCWRGSDRGSFGSPGRNAKQPATGCFVDGWVPLCTLFAALIGASAGGEGVPFPLCPYRWSWRILQRRFSPPPGGLSPANVSRCRIFTCQAARGCKMSPHCIGAENLILTTYFEVFFRNFLIRKNFFDIAFCEQ